MLGLCGGASRSAAEQLAQEEFPAIENLRARNQELLRLLQAKEARRDTLRDQALAEAEGLSELAKVI